MQGACPLCSKSGSVHLTIDGVAYFACRRCDFIYADPELLARIDQGQAPRAYDDDYWRQELDAARERATGSSLARVAEAALYCTIPIQRFVDIGTGPGYLLDALARYLPSRSGQFHGVEKFPPPVDRRSTHPNYACTDLAALGLAFECGVCIEVLEHLTPAMADALASALASVSMPGSLFLFNTGLTEYVRNEDPGYLDPYRRGHVTCWSTRAASQVFGRHGFVVHPLRGKTWAFLVERPRPGVAERRPEDRIWHVPDANRALLTDPTMGEVLFLLGRESARAY